MNAFKNCEALDDIFSVIVLYKTGLHNSISFNSLLKAVENATGVLDILLYNNSSEIHLNTTPYKTQKIIISEIKDDANSGVSKAYNIANAIAKNKKKKWLLLLDQDTLLPSDFFSVFFAQRNLAAISDYKLYVPVIKAGNKIISPANYFLYRGFIKKEIKTGRTSIKKLAIINSGVIIDNNLFEQAGRFNENITLDFSDISFFRRLKKIYSEAYILNVICNHSFSGLEYDDWEKSLIRFRIYNANAIAFSKEKGVIKTFLFAQILFRAAHLSLKFKTLNFLRNIKFN